MVPTGRLQGSAPDASRGSQTFAWHAGRWPIRAGEMRGMKVDPRLHRIVAAQPYPLMFATISGAHLYGFPSPDSDFDLRGVHVLPLEEVVGLQTDPQTIEKSGVVEGLEIDLVTHDAMKFFSLLLKK